MVKKKTCVFISGKGSNLKNLISRSRDHSFPINVCLIISNNKDAHGIKYAKKFNIPFVLIDTKLQNYENKILFNLKNIRLLLFVTGYMKIVSNKIIRNFDRKIINIPTLLLSLGTHFLEY